MQHNTQDPTMHKTLKMKYSHQCSASAFAWDLSGYFCWLLCQTSSSRSVPAFCNVCTTCIHLPLSHTHTAIHLLPNQISVKTIHQPLSFILPTHTAHKTELFLLTFIPLMRNPCWFIIQWYKSLHSQADISIILQTAALGYSNLLQTGLQAEERHVSQYQT